MCIGEINTLKGRYKKKGKKIISNQKCQRNWELSTQAEAAEGNTQSTHLQFSTWLNKKTTPISCQAFASNQYCVNGQPGVYRRKKRSGSKTEIVFTDLLAFQCHHHRETDSAFWIQPAVLALHFCCCFIQGFFSPKKRLFQNIWNTQDSEQKGRLPINFYHNSSFWRQVFLPSTETPSFNESH